MNIFILLLLIVDSYHRIQSYDQYIYPGILWNDTNDNSIQAHSAGILIDPVDGSYWWYGESQKTSNLSDHGVNCYHSKDLMIWQNMGQVLKQKDISVKSIPGPYVVDRPKVVWNDRTKLFVMWFHLDNNPCCTYRAVGVATSSSPNGTFTFIDAFQPDGIPSLDMSLFEDKKDGVVNGVYLVRSCNNSYVGISKLDDNYMNTTGVTSTIDVPREGHAIFYRNNRYYMMTSHISGWSPNPAELFISDRDSLDRAKWSSLGNPIRSDTTFNSQSTFVLPFPSTKQSGTNFYIFMGDRWDYPHLLNATYVWLPFTFNSDTNVTIEWHDQWALTDY